MSQRRAIVNPREPTHYLALCVFYCTVVGLTLARFASTPDRFLFQSFLLLLIPAAVALWSLARSADTRFIVLGLVGFALLANTALRPTTEARGYMLAAVGWLGLVTTLWLGSSVRRTRILALALIGLGALEAAFGLVQAVGGVDQIGGYVRGLGSIATGTYINRNHFAGLLNMTFGLAVGVLYARFVEQSGRRRRSEVFSWTWLVILSSAVVGLAMALSLSRAGTLVLLAILLFVFVLLWWRRRRDRRGLPARVAALLLAVTLMLVAAYGADALLRRFDEVTSSDRPQVYGDTLELIADQPLLGVGPGMYRWYFRPYQTTAVAKIYTHTHNDYLQAAAEWGVPLALVFWGFVAWRFYRAIVMFTATRDPWRAGLGLGCATAILSILLHSLVDFNLQIPANLLVFVTILGLGWAAEKHAGSSRGPLGQISGDGSTGGLARAMVALLLVVVVASGWSVTRRLLASEMASRQPNSDGFQRAVRWDASNPDYHLGLAKLLRSPASIGEAIVHTERAAALSPYDWRAHGQLAELYEVAGRQQEAEQALLTALELSPRDPKYLWRLANFHLRSGREAEFWEPVSRALAADGNLLRAAFSLMIKTRAPAQKVDRAWPTERAATLQLLALVGRLDGSVIESDYLPLLLTRWRGLLDSDQPPSLAEGRALIEGLLKARAHDEARREWIALTKANSLHDQQFSDGTNLLWNGSYELPITGLGLGWRLRRVDGASVERLAFDGSEGAMALAISFAGTKNLNFSGLEQRVVVQPEASYRLSFAAAAEGLTTDRGPYLQITDPTPRRAIHSTEEFLGGSGWKEHAFTFSTGPETSMISIRVRRKPSRRADSRIDGTLWLDSMALVRLESQDSPTS